MLNKEFKIGHIQSYSIVEQDGILVNKLFKKHEQTQLIDKSKRISLQIEYIIGNPEIGKGGYVSRHVEYLPSKKYTPFIIEHIGAIYAWLHDNTTYGNPEYANYIYSLVTEKKKAVKKKAVKKKAVKKKAVKKKAVKKKAVKKC